MKTSYPAPRLRAAIVQLESVHEECVPAITHFLRANGADVQVYLNRQIHDLRGDIAREFPSLQGRMHYPPMSERPHWGDLADELGSYDVLVFNTFQREGITQWARNIGRPVIGVVHNPRLLLEAPTGMAMVRSGQAEILTLAPHVTAWMLARKPELFARVGTVTSAFPELPDVPVEQGSGRRRLTVPGAVNFNARDYPGIVAALPRLFDRIERDRLEISVIGGGADRPRLLDMVEAAGLSDVFTFAELDESGFVGSATYYRELLQSTFLMPTLPEGMAAFRDHKITSAVPTSVGLGLPMVVDRWTEAVYRVPCVNYPAGEMPSGIEAAVSMPENDVKRLHEDLWDFRTRLLDRSVAEMRLVLDRAEAWSPPPAPALSFTPSSLRRESIDDFVAFAKAVVPHSYAQRFQDLWALWELGFPTTDRFFVEAGALNGRDFSNTYLLEQLGWQGVAVEPHPGYAEALSENRKCTVSTDALLDRTGATVTFQAVRRRPALSRVEGYGSQANEAARADHVTHEVRTISLADLLDGSGAPRPLDYLSLDTQGSELAILEAFDFDTHPVRCVTVAHEEVPRERLIDLMQSRGYRRKWPELSGHDDWFVRDDLTTSWEPAAADTLMDACATVPTFDNRLEERLTFLGGLAH